MPWVVFSTSTNKIVMVCSKGLEQAKNATRRGEEYCWQNGNPKRGDSIK